MLTGIRLVKRDRSSPLRVTPAATEERAPRQLEQLLSFFNPETNPIVWKADVQTTSRASRSTPTITKLSFVGQRADTILGYRAERWLDFWANRFHPQDREWTNARYRKVLKKGTEHTFRYRARAADGRIVWLRDRVWVIRDGNGRARKLLGLTVELTNQDQAVPERSAS